MLEKITENLIPLISLAKLGGEICCLYLAVGVETSGYIRSLAFLFFVLINLMSTVMIQGCCTCHESSKEIIHSWMKAAADTDDKGYMEKFTKSSPPLIIKVIGNPIGKDTIMTSNQFVSEQVAELLAANA